MAIKTKEEVMNAIKDRLGEDVSDEALALIEDVSDTIDDLTSKANGDGKDWKAEYEALDKSWRQKYTERFFSGSDNDDQDTNGKEDDIEPSAPKTYNELFKTE